MVQAFPQTDQAEVSSKETTEGLDEIPTDAKENEKKGDIARCTEVMANNQLNFSNFWHGAAHGIHSIGLEEIRHFFEPDAPEHIKIPVVNADLSAEEMIVFHAPLRGYDEDFKTMAMKVMAFFMLHDKPYFYQQGVNTLEKVTHQYHMHEIYSAAAPIYRKMKEDPPTDPELCPCVNDVTLNGILTELVNIAKQLKYFARQPRAVKIYIDCIFVHLSYIDIKEGQSGCGGTLKGSTVERPSRLTTSRPSLSRGRGKRNVENTTEMITQYEKEYLADSSHENAQKLLNVNPWKPNTLVGPEQWISHEAMLTWSMLEEKELNDFAVFMYCKLNQPDLDHIKDLFD
eukprot:GFUD01014891.1.p1 GENE.GFUD01014891.1~~GFUD01014891.1.p1  ORF type:complete len:386 (+),score=81.48 GFUD01014891.1:131-1159(+)